MVACVPVGRLVVGVDDSLNSLAALRRAAWSADRRQAELEIVHVIPEDSDARALEAADRNLAAVVCAALQQASPCRSAGMSCVANLAKFLPG